LKRQPIARKEEFIFVQPNKTSKFVYFNIGQQLLFSRKSFFSKKKFEFLKRWLRKKSESQDFL